MMTGQMDGKGTGVGKENRTYTGQGPSAGPVPHAGSMVEDEFQDGSLPSWVRGLGAAWGNVRGIPGAMDEGLERMGEEFQAGAGPPEVDYRTAPVPPGMRGMDAEMGPPIPPEIQQRLEMEGMQSRLAEEGERADMARMQEEERSQALLDTSLQRVRGGDLGSPDSPLRLEGSSGQGPMTDIKAPIGGRGDEHLAPEERYFAPEEPAWRKEQDRQSMISSNRNKAERMRDFLSSNEDIEPAMRSQMMQDSRHYDQLADQSEKREDAKRDRVTVQLMKTQEILGAIEQERVRAEGGVARENIKAQYKQQQEMEDNFNALERMLVQEEDDDTVDKIVMAMAQLLNEDTNRGVEAEADRIRERYGI
jgi:hypothetical protein